MLLLLAAFAAAFDFSAWTANHPPSPHPESAYHFAEDLFAEAADIVAERPGVVTPFVVAEAVEGRPVWGFRVRDPSGPTKHKLLLFANIHALEWVPSEVALAALREAAEHPIPGVQLDIIVSLNPDGRARVEADLRDGKNVYRRGNANQVDLNRDFAVNREAKAIWKALIPRRYAVSPAPLSQPESRGLDQLAAAERYESSISLHAFGGFIYYPWAGLWKRADDYRVFQHLGVTMQAGMTHHPYKPRQLSRWGFFFRGQGMELDHLYGTYGTLAFLVETTRSGLTPFRPADWTSHFRLYNPRDPAPHVRDGAGLVRAWTHAFRDP